MANIPPVTEMSSTDPHLNEGESGHVDAPELRVFVIALFFIFGGITSLNDVIIPKLKELFTLNYTQAMLVQFAFHRYLVIGGPGATIGQGIGYMRGAVVGLRTNDGRLHAVHTGVRYATYELFLVRIVRPGERVSSSCKCVNPLISLGRRARAQRLTLRPSVQQPRNTIFPRVGTAADPRRSCNGHCGRIEWPRDGRLSCRRV